MNPRATERDGILEIRQVTAADAGRYRCTVTSNAGTLDGYSLVDVEGKLGVFHANQTSMRLDPHLN